MHVLLPREYIATYPSLEFQSIWTPFGQLDSTFSRCLPVASPFRSSRRTLSSVEYNGLLSSKRTFLSSKTV